MNPASITWNGSRILTERVYLGQWCAQSEDLDVCGDDDCKCRLSKINYVAIGISHWDAIANWIQRQIEDE